MIPFGRKLPIVLLGVGVAGLVGSGVCYQATGGDPWCTAALLTGTIACIGAFALAMQRRPEG